MTEQEKTKNLSGPIPFQKSLDESLASKFFIKGNWPKSNWWEDFHDENLTILIQEALTKNPSLKSVESRIEQIKSRARITKSRLFPSLFFTADDNWRYLSKNGFTHLLNPSLPLNGYEIDLSLAFQYEFDFWGKNRNKFLSVLGEIKTEEAEFEQAKLIITTALAQSYFALSINESKKYIYEKLYDIQNLKYRLQEQLQQSALSSKITPLWDEEKMLEAKQDLLTIEDEIQTERHFINVLAGKSPDEHISSLTVKQNFSPIPIPRNISLNLLSRRPDLIAQIWRIESLSHLVSAAKADFFPNINLAAMAGLASISFQNLFSLGSKSAGIEPALSLPVFTAGAIKANVKEKKALFDQAVFEYNQLILFSAQEVTDLLSHIHTTFTKKQQQEEIVKAANKRYYLTKLNQDSALATAFASLDNQEELLLQEIKDLTLLYNQYAFVIKLIKALGGGFMQTSPIGPRNDS